MKNAAKLILSIILILSLSPLCFAQPLSERAPIIPSDAGSEKLVLPHTSEKDISEGKYLGATFLPELTKTIIGLSGGFAFLFVVIGGVQILTAYGDEEKLGSAKKTITYAIIGLIISILSYAIVSIISGIQIGTPIDKGSEEWQELNKGLDEDEQKERDELRKKAIEKGMDPGDANSMTTEELKALDN